MTKFSKRIVLFLALISTTFVLASCSNYNFYEDWKSAGATIESENVYKSLTLDEVKDKRDAKETFALIVASSTDSTACSAITKIQEQADVVGYTGNVYFISSKDVYNASLSTQKEFKEVVGNKEFTSSTSDKPLFVLMVYNKGNILADTSSSNNYSAIENYLNNGNSDTLVINYEFLAHYLFSINELYKNN